MPDWEKIVKRELATLKLPPSAKQEVIAELAAHLEDSAAADPHERTLENRALAEVPWQKLRGAIERTKREKTKMNRRTKTLWLPSIAILFVVGLVLMLLNRLAIVQHLIWIASMAMFLRTAAFEANRLSPRTRCLWLPALMNLTLAFGLFLILDALNLDEPGIATAGNVAKAFRMPWLLPLPMLGAVGALLARRAQASWAERVIAGLAPSLVWSAVLAVLGTIFALDRRDFGGVSLQDLAVSTVGLVILPALALSLGTMPFLRDSKAAQKV